MSLHHLGIAHFPVLHRQFSSPTHDSFNSSASPDLTQDNKDIVIERLNDLVLRLSKPTSSSLDDRTVTALHSQVDRIEVLIRGAEKGKIPDHRDADETMSPAPLSVGGEDAFWGPLSPARQVGMWLPQPRSPVPDRAIVTAADELASRLAATINELQVRREESDHIHDLLLTRAENAAKRILVLEHRIVEMGNDFDSNQSELGFLRIQLQGIEAQFSRYTPQDEDEELSRSIMNWKVDWEEINRCSKARRKKCHASMTALDDHRVS